MKTLIVPFFLPFQGCPHRCLYCAQEQITGQPAALPSADEIQATLDRAMASPRYARAAVREIAFFGGTFTLLPLPVMEERLSCAAAYVAAGHFTSIRVSTRPDALADGALALMKAHHVRLVELGAQSMNDAVLAASLRGHSAADTVRAVARLRAQGFQVGLQLMPGLPGDTPATWRATLAQVLALRPSVVRLYPTLVFEGTGLARCYRAGLYQPLTLEEAVERCVQACDLLEAHGIPVIRLGLMSAPALQGEAQALVAGPWHPAFGFLVRARAFRDRIAALLPPKGRIHRIRISVQPRDLPLLHGYRNEGLQWLEARTAGGLDGIAMDDTLSRGTIRIEAA